MINVAVVAVCVLVNSAVNITGALITRNFCSGGEGGSEGANI